MLPAAIPPYISTVVYVILLATYVVTIISCVVVILSENRNPIRSIAWIIALIFLPIAGLVLYLFFGRSLKNLHLISRHNKRRLLNKQRRRKVDFSTLDLSPSLKQLIKLDNALNQTPYTVDNEIRIFIDGREKFEALKRDLRGARHTIYLQYYIFTDDRLGHEIADILIDKARHGVDVRVIYDHVGSFSAPSRFFTKMRQAGVDAHPFFRVTFPQLANRINWRNHRKIVVIDHEVGYIGGMNIAERYEDSSTWRDTHLRVRGGIVESLIYSFAVDWSFMNQPLEMPSLRLPDDLQHNDVGIQLVTSGPNDRWNALSLSFLKAIASAVKCIYIQTPYFLPTEALLSALQTAAMSGIDVRIMIPRKSDSHLLTLASFSYVTQCLKAGIKVYLYEQGMLHAKMMTVDETLVTTGSTNFDFRSFENNFESNLFIYDRAFNEQMRNIFFDDIRRCTKLTFSQWHRRPRLQRGFESILRLLAPIL